MEQGYQIAIKHRNMRGIYPRIPESCTSVALDQAVLSARGAKDQRCPRGLVKGTTPQGGQKWTKP